MRVLLTWVCLGAVALAAPRAASVQFSDGTTMRGQMIGFDAKKGFQWIHPSVENGLWIKAPAVRRLQFSGGMDAGKPHGGRVKFSNGDELAADILGLGPDGLAMDTWFAGKLTAPRDSLGWLVPGGAGKVIYQGPKGLGGWGAGLIGVLLGDEGELNGGVTIQEVMEDGPALAAGFKVGDIVTHVNGKKVAMTREMIRLVKENNPGDVVKIRAVRGNEPREFDLRLKSLNWKMEGGALVCQGIGGMIGRELEWPPNAEFSFDFEWTNVPSMEVAFLSDKLREANAFNGYKMRLMQNSFQILRQTSQGGGGLAFNSAMVANAQFRPKAGRKASFSILLNREKKQLSVMVDGKLIRTWTDKAGFPGEGGAIGLYPRTANVMKISNLRLREWNGVLPDGKNPNPNGVDGKDKIHFRNGDSLSGQVKAIEKPNLIVSTEFGEVKVALANIQNIVFAAAKPKPAEGDAEDEKGDLPPERGGLAPTPPTVPVVFQNAPLGANDGVATFHLGPAGRLSGQMLTWDEAVITIESTLFGQVKLKPGAVSSIQFR